MLRTQILLAGALIASGLVAQDTAELLARMKVMEQRIQSLESEVQALKARPAATPAVTVSAEPQEQSAEPLRQSPMAITAGKVFNPDIAAIGNFVGAVGNGGPRAI